MASQTSNAQAGGKGAPAWWNVWAGYRRSWALKLQADDYTCGQLLLYDLGKRWHGEMRIVPGRDEELGRVISSRNITSIIEMLHPRRLYNTVRGLADDGDCFEMPGIAVYMDSRVRLGIVSNKCVCHLVLTCAATNHFLSLVEGHRTRGCGFTNCIIVTAHISSLVKYRGHQNRGKCSS